MFGDVAFSQAPFAALGGKTLASALAESATATSAVSQVTFLGGLIDEAAAMSSSDYSANNNLTATQAEIAAAQAAQTVLARVGATQAETSRASALQAAVFTGLAAQVERTTATAAPSAQAELLAALAEVANASAEFVGGRAYFKSIEESATASDAVSLTVVFTGTVQEFATALATNSAFANRIVNVTGVQLYVNIGNVLVWAVIDDTQDANWQNIDDTQSPGWTNIPS